MTFLERPGRQSQVRPVPVRSDARPTVPREMTGVLWDPTVGGHRPVRPSVTRTTRSVAPRETPRISISGSDLTMLLSMSGLLGGVLGVVGLIEFNS
ncbi:MULTISPECIES: hypothetical protein [Actinomycetes]|uniref:hypothetical protein n=1 Tax=Actinomycetes TaxID=1760 RepID=UPI0012DC4302|nr:MULTISPECIES: hypothetical protein [Actinomycetes]